MLKVLKCFSSLGGVMMLLVGLAFTGITIYAFFNEDIFLTNDKTKHNILNSMIIISTGIVSISITAIIGVIKKKCCIIVVYQFFLVVFFIFLVGFGIVSNLIPNLLFDGNCKESKNGLIQQVNNLYEKSNEYFCKPECLCSMQQSSIDQYQDQDRKALKLYAFNDTIGVNSTQNCEIFKNSQNQASTSLAATVEGIQKFLQCSDWCPENQKNNLFYRFSNVNNGKPKHTCYIALHDAFYHYAHMIGIACYSIAGVLLLVCVCNICLCCHPEKRKLQFRDRFIYVVNDSATVNYKKI